MCRRCCTSRRRLQRSAQVLEVRCLPCALHNNNPLSIIFAAAMFSLLPSRFNAINSFKPRRPQCPAYLFKVQRSKTPLKYCFFFVFVTIPSGAVARCEDRPIFSAAARAGGGASSAGSVAGLLSFRVLASRRLFVWGVCAWVCVECGYALHS